MKGETERKKETNKQTKKGKKKEQRKKEKRGMMYMCVCPSAHWVHGWLPACTQALWFP